jgi:hypothetical protein
MFTITHLLHANHIRIDHFIGYNVTTLHYTLLAVDGTHVFRV